MTDRPILFSTPMIRALLEGRKTQTRRVLKPQPNWIESSGRWSWPIPKSKQIGCDCVVSASREWHEYLAPHQYPICVGDRLWVRESLDMGDPRFIIGQCTYKADGAHFDLTPDGAESWAGTRNQLVIPSMFMPRWASRLTLTITGVKIERLQDLSRGDAMDEGCPFPNMAKGDNPRDWFAALWDTINGPGAWAQNPWVAAYEFTVEKRNIDRGTE